MSQSPSNGQNNEKIEELSEILGASRRIVAFTGAGVSTESNIPDFRSASGVNSIIEKEYGRPAEVLLSHGFFEEHPDIFFDYLKRFLIFPGAQPNDAHKALAALEREGKLAAVVTQNIDGLHEKAGSKTVYELHGSIYRNHCVACGREYGLDFALAARGVPRCESCGGIVRPGVVLYGESLDPSVIDRSVRAIARADTLLVMGTSLAVYPAAGLLGYFHGSNVAVINKAPTPLDSQARLVVSAAAGAAMRSALEKLSIAM